MIHSPDPLSGRLSAFLLLAALASLATGCRAPSEDAMGFDDPKLIPESIVLARVNDESLTLRHAMEVYMSSHGGGHNVLVQGEPAVRELAGRLVERELFYAEAVALGLPAEEEILEAVEEHRYGQAEIVFWRLEVEEKVEVSEEEVEAFYAKTDVALSLFLMETESREEAEGLRERVVAGEDFGELASKHSLHGSRTFGGALSYIRRGDLDPALEEVAFALIEPGSTTAVVETRAGWGFVRLEGRTTNPDRPDRELMIPRIRNILQDRHEDALRSAVEERVRTAAGVEIVADPALRDLVLGDAEDETVLARSDGETLPLEVLRDALDHDAIARASADEVDPILLGMIDEWALKRAVRRAARESGLLEHEEVVPEAEAFARDAALGMLYKDYVYADVEITEEELLAYYEANRETGFTKPTEIRLAYVVSASAEGAEELRRLVEAGADLEELARQQSIDPAAHMTGGRAQWLRPGQILPEVEDVAFALAEGEVGGPVETEVGYFVLQVFERKEGRVIPFEAARASATRRLFTELQKEAYATWVQRLRERAQVELDLEGIEQAVVWLDREATAREAAKSGAAESEVEPDVIGPVPTPPAGHGGARP